MDFAGRIREMETKIISIDPKELKLLEVNARYMKHDEYQRLVENVKRDGKLTSVPFCCIDDNWDWEVLSGNHRVQAAIDAGLETIDVMVTEEPLTKSQKIAIQLSHNSITGQDDMAILKDLYEQIDDINYKAYSGLDDETLAMLDKVGSDSMSAIGLQYQLMNIVVLPTELSEAMKIIKEVKEVIKDNAALTMRFGEYDKWLDTLDDVSSASGIKNTATAFLVMLDIVSNHMDDVKDMWLNEKDNDKQWVPIASVTGRSKVNAADGRVLNNAFEKMISKGDIKKDSKEKGLAFLSQFYLNNCNAKKESK